MSADGWRAAQVQPLLVGTPIVDIADKPEDRDQKITKATEKMFKNYPSGRNGAMRLRLGGLFKPVSLHS